MSQNNVISPPIASKLMQQPSQSNNNNCNNIKPSNTDNNANDANTSITSKEEKENEDSVDNDIDLTSKSHSNPIANNTETNTKNDATTTQTSQTSQTSKSTESLLDGNVAGNEGIEAQSLNRCVTCQQSIKAILTNSNNSNNNNNSDVDMTRTSETLFARQCMYRHCPTRSQNVNLLECEKCSQISCCRGCNILLCHKCRKILKVLACGYQNSIDNENSISSNSNNVGFCSSFICSQFCYKKIISKYNILLKFNGFDVKQHVSTIQFKKLFMKPYLSGLYDSMHLPTKDQYRELLLMSKNLNKNDNNTNNNNNSNGSTSNDTGNETIEKEINEIDWKNNDKNEWFPFHECQGCKKHNCGCCEWVCCVNCRKYYCEQCERTKLHKCKLEECENYTCCQWQVWKRNCIYCNDLGNCQLLFCTHGHCHRHYIT